MFHPDTTNGSDWVEFTGAGSGTNHSDERSRPVRPSCHHDLDMTQERRRTINSQGEIVDRPYGVSRWSSPKTYACAHPDCPHPATVLRSADAHPSEVAKTHNCCGTH